MDWSKFINWCSSNGKRTRTIQKYLWCLNKIPDDILSNSTELKQWLDGQYLEPSTKYAMTTSVRTYLRFLKKPESIINEFTFPKLNIKDKITFLNIEQIKKFYGSCRNDFEKLVVRIFLETGVRRAVLLEIKPRDIDFEKSQITIQADYEGNKGGVTYARDLSPQLLSMLKNYISNNRTSSDDKIFCFTYRREKKMVPYASQGQMIYKMINGIGKRCGMSWATPHTLRHSFATHFFDKTKNLPALQKAMGDRCLESVRPYVHPLEDAKKIHAELTFNMFDK